MMPEEFSSPANRRTWRRREKRQRQKQRAACQAKKPYMDRESAEDAEWEFLVPYRLHPYHCPICEMWHLTKQEDERSDDD